MANWAATHLPCTACGSSDGLSINDAGWQTCFVCKETSKIDADDALPTKRLRERPQGLVEDVTINGIPARGLSAETCRKWDYGTGLHNGRGVHVASYFRDGQVVAQKLRTADKGFQIVGDSKRMPLLYGLHLWKGGGKKIVITEGEIDALTVSQLQANKWPVVSLSNGAGTARKAIAENLEYLDGYEQVILMFDEDEAGREATEAAAEVLPPGKAYVAKLPLKDPNECLMKGQGQAVIDALWNATPWRPDAILAGSELLDRILNYKGPQGQPWPYKGVEAMCKVMAHPAIFTLVAGTGSGKTTVCRALEHYLILRGERVGALHLEETPERTALGIAGYHMGKRLDLSVADVDPDALRLAYNESAGRDGVFFYDHFGSTGVDNIISKVRYLARAGNCKYIFLDHLSIVVSGLETTDERKAIDTVMTRLRMLVQETDICLILVNHLRRGTGTPAENGGEISLSDLRGSQAIAQLSDGVIALERDQQAKGDKGNLISWRWLKNRIQGDVGIACKLLFVKETGKLVEFPADYMDEEDTGEGFSDTTASTPDDFAGVPF